MLARVMVLLPDIHDGGSVVSPRRPHVAFSCSDFSQWKGEIDNATGQLSKRPAIGMDLVRLFMDAL